MRERGHRLETALLLLAILLVGAYFRFVGLDWGEGQPIHPDEEFMRQVVSAVQLPDRVGLYFDTANSPLNPYNQRQSFFVYGTLPLFLTRAVGEGLDRGCQAVHDGVPTAAALAARTLSPFLLGRPVEECWVGSFSGMGSRMVGRSLAALFDLGALLLLFATGRRLFSPRIGLLASCLYALTVLPIQQAHFFTVDGFANLFVIATLYLAVRAAQSGGWGAFGLAGLATGLGMACKISVWPLGLLIALAGLVWWGKERASRNKGDRGEEEKSGDEEEGDGDEEEKSENEQEISGNEEYFSVWFPIWRVTLAAVVAFIAFRIAQPYAFQGPGFFDWELNGQWLGNMAEIRRLMSGKVDTFPGHQWANRTPVLFPWLNMVIWGMGLPLGLAAWAGWAAAGVVLWRSYLRSRREGSADWLSSSLALLLVWTWGTAYFLYQSTQWVKSMRYLLPVYPPFVLLAAWLLGRRWWTQKPERARKTALVWTVIAVLLVVGGTFGWAWAFSSIYTRSHTRIAASRWIFENIPAAATVHLHTPDGEAQVQVPVPAGTVHADGVAVVTPFQVGQEVDLAGVTLNRVVDASADPEGEVVRVAVTADSGGEIVLAEAEERVNAPPSPPGRPASFLLGPVRLLPDTTYYLVTESVSGGPVQLLTSVIGTEHWDWAPPLRVDGHDPFGGMYRGLSTSSDGTMQLYFDDNREKRTNLLNWLDEADYIVIGSNRLYGSIPRLPTRYPLTIAYYQALFDGELGFELVADFTSYPALGPFQFPDTEEPFPVPEAAYQYRAAPLSLPLLPAEEAFSVYDHPRVLVFRKTSAYSRAQAEAVLAPSLLDHVVWVTPRQEARGARQPVFDEETWAEQRAGGTWSEMFNRDSLLNWSSWAAAVAWYLASSLLGWLAFPILFAAFPLLRDRGYGLARAFGLLVVAYLTWLAASLHILPNTRSTLALAVLLLGLGGGLAAWFQRRSLRGFLRAHWRTLLVYEGLFLLLYAGWAVVRSLNPDLWHMYVGGEKPMDFAYLNAVIKSSWFPPYDPWFAGGYINYYYFGFVLIGSLSKLLGIMPSVAYNLTLALFYALTGGAAFSVASSLVGRGGRRYRPYLAGFLALLFVLILGNLGEARLLSKAFRIVAGEPTIHSTIPGLPELVQMLRGLGMVLRGAPLPFRPETPYWDSTRMIPADATGVGPITEFPAFTFLYGDPHAHMLALPYTLFALALVVSWARGRRGQRPLSIIVGGLVIGSLWATNGWDYPTYLLLGLAGMAIGLSRRIKSWRAAVSALARAGVLVALTVLLFLPYTHNYVAGYTSVHIWNGPRTPLSIYFALVGQFLFPLFTLLALDARRAWRQVAQEVKKNDRLRRWLAAGAVGLLSLSLVLAVAAVPVVGVALPALTLAAALVIAADLPVERRVVWLLLSLALSLSIIVEVVVLEGDIGRMNTVFKFYNQVWVLLAIGAAVAVTWLVDRLRRWPIDARQVWWLTMGVLVAAMALFPLMAIPAKVRDRITNTTGPTLDGMAYMRYGHIYDVRGELDLAPDYYGITWMQDNIEGSPVVLEALGEREYLWGNRVSIYTGLPAVVGWRWHQVQQRIGGGAGEVEHRYMDVADCYNTTEISLALEIIHRYNVRYIYVGPYERLYYEPRGLAKFSEMAGEGLLRIVYDQYGVKIYKVIR